MLNRYYILLALVIIASSCAPRYNKAIIQAELLPETKLPASGVRCDYQDAYEPDEYMPMRFIRVNFHFMRDGQGNYNFPEAEARTYVRSLVEACNEKLANNQPMNLPVGNHTPALPTRYRLVLTGDPATGGDGIYFHNDDTACFFAKKTMSGRFSETDQSMFKYSVGVDSVLNIYMIEHHPDSLKSNPKYDVTAAGISYGHNVKIFGAYYNHSTTFMTNEGNPFTKGYWFYTGLVNHEIGHTLGLNHTWKTDDGCDDTPKHPGCWGPGDPPCDGITSNNMMDYNGCQCALTPCQLSRIHHNFSKENSRQRTLLQEKWCTYSSIDKVNIPRDATVVLKGSRDYNSDIILQEGSTLIVHCTVSLPAEAKVIVKPGAKLILDGGILTNRCGDQWGGIEVWESIKFGIKGEVVMANGGRVENVMTVDLE